MSENIAGKVVVVTGASSGLGTATARYLAARGAHLFLGARRLDRLEVLADELKIGVASVVQTDVTKPLQVKELIDRAVAVHGRIDVLLNNAGLMPRALLEAGNTAEWDQAIDVNIKGVLYGIAAALPHMKVQKSGHIINVSSSAAHAVRPASSVYAATKAAVRTISEGLRQEVKPYNIRTTVISPGAVQSELLHSISDPVEAKNMAAFYDSFAVSAETFARAVAYAIAQPEDVDVNEILFRPTAQV